MCVCGPGDDKKERSGRPGLAVPLLLLMAGRLPFPLHLPGPLSSYAAFPSCFCPIPFLSSSSARFPFTPSTSAHLLRPPIRSTAHAYRCHVYVLSLFLLLPSSLFTASSNSAQPLPLPYNQPSLPLGMT